MSRRKIFRNVPLRLHSTLRVGGRADMLSIPKNAEELSSLISFARKKKIRALVVGNGSNILFPDSGFRGLIIKLAHGLSDIKFDGVRVTAGAGVMMSDLISKLCQRGLKGLEFAYGVPATVGGAAVMNFGAWGREIGDIIESVDALDPRKMKRVLIPRKKMRFSYRKSSLDRYIILSVTFKLSRGKKRLIRKKMKKILEKRKVTQPLGIPNAGCVFKNPPGSSAGKLIDEAGLAGKRVGDAQISTKHANFIINLGRAKAGDVLTLMKKMSRAVKAKFGISLNPELKVIR